jgi:hypothetical protein
MGDGGWRRIDAPASRHFLTLLSGERRIGGFLLGPIRKGARSIGAALPSTKLLGQGCVSAAKSREAR